MIPGARENLSGLVEGRGEEVDSGEGYLYLHSGEGYYLHEIPKIPINTP